MKAPFPWFGGKSRVADLVWQRLGNVPNYVEPFFGSGAVLLGRPHAPNTETVNDLDCMIANFWRALRHDPDAVAMHADNPVNEADQHARHLWLASQEEFRERMKTEPDYYDAKIAGWWVWGQCIWIGSGWCAVQRPHLGDAGKGVHRKLPHLGDAGTGDVACVSDLTLGTLSQQMPFLNRPGAGVNSKERRAGLYGYMHALAARMRHVRVCCGDWSRICGPSPTHLGKRGYDSYDDTYANFINAIVPAINMSIQIAARAAVFSGQYLWEQKPADAIGGIWSPAAVGRTPWGSKNFLPVLFYGTPPKPGRHRPLVIADYSRAEEDRHPCPKPIQWMRWLVGLGSEPGDTVLDPFCGSGTTLVAAKDLGRQAIGIEISESYCEIAAKRLAQKVMQF